jgi:hypothetical protein
MRTTVRARLAALCLISGLLLFGAIPASAGAAEPAPRWHVSQLAAPTVLVPGSSAEPNETNAYASMPHYSVEVTNVGGKETTGPITVTEHLPAGVTVAAAALPERRSEEEEFEPCESPSAETVICRVAGSVLSGGIIRAAVPIDVGAFVVSPAVSTVEVEGGGAQPVSESVATTVGDELPSLEFLPGSEGLSGHATAETGLDADLAGSHPLFMELESNFPTRKFSTLIRPVQDPKSLEFRLPSGFVVNPQAPAKLCTEAELQTREKGGIGEGGCPPESQVGLVSVQTQITGPEPVTLSLYAMQPAFGTPAEFAFTILGVIVHVQGSVDGSFRLTAKSSEILAKFAVLGVRAVLWGNIADSRHDRQRAGKGCPEKGCSVEPTVPFVTMPTSCGEPLGLEAGLTSWQGGSTTAERSFLDVEGNPLKLSGCNALAFEPTIESKATTNVADSPSGLEFDIHQPQDESIEGRATAALKNARVTLPEGMTVNPAGANGLGVCSEEQMGYAPVEGRIQFETTPQSCPSSSKIGTLEASTPLLGHKLPGAVYVAKPLDNPFGSLLALYLAVEDEESGIIAKLAGKVEPDPTTGRLTATFAENPELPLEDIKLHVFNGANATLKTPLTCGTATTLATLTPWSTPEGADAEVSDSFQVQAAPAPGPCPGQESQAPKSPSFTAGTVSPLSGAYSPFVLRLSRSDGTQRITGVETTLPEGLVGKAAGIPYCPEADIALARSREAPEKGKEEQASPSCPASSEVGTVNVTAGSGSAPIPVSGHVYWAGPYKGAPLSVVVIVPAVAGPFDLGAVVDRVALYVGEYDARIHAVADPLPTIKDGIPLDARSIELKLDRPNFTLNPTSCEAMAIEGSVSTQAAQSAPLKNNFQVGECERLGFKPKLAISLKGQTNRTGHPALKATVTYPTGGEYANIAKAQVSLPHSEFLDQGNIGKACTKPVLAAGACPASSVYGKVKAWTPLLGAPLEGNVYLVGGYGYKLPALVAELNGQIKILLVGKVDTGSNKGIRNTFEAVPDAPVEKFVLELKGGKKYGLLENSENICKKKQKAAVSLTAQNGKTLTLSPLITNSCKSKGK